jgi:hypothetical protein
LSNYLRFMKLRLLVLLLLISAATFAQGNELLIADAKTIKDAYTELMKEPRASISQMNYIAAFPATKEIFFHVFYPDALDQLYPTRKQYLDALIRISESLPKEVLVKILKTEVNMKASDDIVGQLQTLTLSLAAQHTDVFTGAVKSMWPKDQKNLAPFIADTDDPNFDTLIENLKTAKANNLVNQLTNAHEERNND